MKFAELLKFSLGNLRRRKLRTVLTLLGVMIGTASIVVMMSLGVGMNNSYIETLESSSSITRITVGTYGYYDSSSSSDSSNNAKLTEDVINGFSSIEHVTCATPVYNFEIIAKTGKYQAYLTVEAMSHDMLEALQMPVIKGALPAEDEELQLIAGAKVGYNFYDADSNDYSWGDEPTVDVYNTSLFVIYDTDNYYNEDGSTTAKKYLLKCAAEVGTEDTDSWSDYDYSCYADLEAVQKLFRKLFKKNKWPNQSTDSKGKPITPFEYSQAYVLVDDINNVSDVQKQISDMGFRASSDLDYLEAMKKQSRTIQYALAGIGSVSLVVAAIGITNTMLMSIFERTKEIGIFKVLGCSLGNIRSMFLIEAALIGFFGGILGLGLSFALSAIVNVLIGSISVIPLWLAMLGLGFAVGVGMIAGISPALRAVRLSPLEAIRSL